jgi:imidazolonepropionase-like amidohydrolase
MRMKSYYCRSVLRPLLLLLVSLPVFVQAQFQQQPTPEPKELDPVSQTYAITNATVTQGPGRKLEKATVVIKDGLILNVGKGISIPSEAIVIKGDSLHVYAGFIDGLSRVGVAKPKEDPNRERPKDPGNPTPDFAGITPQNDVRASISPTEKSIEELRALGFTAAQVVPYGGMLPGKAAIISLSGKTTDAMVLVPNSALFSELAGAQRVYPATAIGVIAKWRELYKQSVQAKNYENLYSSNRAGLARPKSDRVLEAFYPVIDKKMPVIFEADRFLETQRVMGLQNDLGFSLLIADIKEGWDAIPKLKSTGTRVFLSLDLPEDKKDEKKEGKGGAKKDEPKKEEKKEDKPTGLSPAEKEALEKRRNEFLAMYVGQAASFQKAGVPFGFSTLSVKTADIKANLGRMIKAGLTEDQALAALTTAPAQLLGLSDRMGTVDNGKIANLVLSDKPYFNEKAKVRYVFVDGAMYKYDAKEQPKADAPKLAVAGSWTVSTEWPSGRADETVTLKQEGSNLTGSISGGTLANAITLEGVELNGTTLKYSYTVEMGGQSYKVDVTATVEGTSFKGTVTHGTKGSYQIEGKKDPNN